MSLLPRLSSPPRLVWPALIWFATVAPVGTGAWMLSRYEDSAEQARFEQTVAQAHQTITLRLRECETKVLALASWLDNTEPLVDAAAWELAEARLQVGRAGACTGAVTASRLLQPERLPAFEAEQSARLGRPYQVRPPGQRPWYAPNVLVAPATEYNQRMLGLDPANAAKRRNGLEHARDTGRPAATGRVDLRMLNDSAMAVMLYAPVYRRGMPQSTVAQRRSAVVGWVGQPLRIDEVVAATAAEYTGLGLALIDPQEDAGSDAPSSAPSRLAALDQPLRFGERDWVLRATPQGGPQAGQTWRASGVLAAAGLLLASLAATAGAFLLRQQGRAYGLARRFSRKLRVHASGLRAVLEGARDGIVQIDMQGCILTANRAAELLLARTDLIGRDASELFAPDEREGAATRYRDAVRRSRLGEVIPASEIQLQHADGHLLPVRSLMSRAVVQDREQMIWLIGDVSREHALRAQIEHLALHDSLTGLPNRLQLEERARHALQHAGQQGQGMALVLMDLDRFKQINDTLGHPVGDRLLQVVAQRLAGSVRGGDMVARMGGDEFVLLLRDTSSPAEAMRVVDKVLCAFRGSELDIDGHRLRVTPSVGVALYPAHGSDLASLLSHADLAMYRAKAAGGDTATLFDPERHAINAARLRLETDLRLALPSGELRLHYQPLIEAASGRVTGLEALMRWHHPVLGLVPPCDFIGIAEETGEIVAIGAWALRQACADLARLRPQWPTLHMAVNVSARQLLGHNLVRDVQTALDAAALPGSALEIEITESALVETQDHVLDKLAQLRALGLGIAIDDFGTGYSSLAYLASFPVTTLKVDRSFVRQIDSELGPGSLASAIVSLAHSMGLETVAEGVETAAQWSVLRETGCERVQGFLFSPAVPFEQLAETLARIEAGSRRPAAPRREAVRDTPGLPVAP
ncbi:MAG TPA: EAL domain-containing protein [Ideonella sp.]|nr:EAL domain-containing protein [Ideonella sp.]